MNIKEIKQALAGIKGTTFASIVTNSEVKPAAKFKGMAITKITRANIRIFASLNDKDAFAKAVRRSAGRIEENQPENVENFVAGTAFYTHSDPECFSVVTHRTNGTEYLYYHYNNAASTYCIDGTPVTADEVAQYLTPSEAKKVLNPDDLNYNKTNDILHAVDVRVAKLSSIVALTLNGQGLK